MNLIPQMSLVTHLGPPISQDPPTPGYLQGPSQSIHPPQQEKNLAYLQHFEVLNQS